MAVEWKQITACGSKSEFVYRNWSRKWRKLARSTWFRVQHMSSNSTSEFNQSIQLGKFFLIVFFVALTTCQNHSRSAASLLAFIPTNNATTHRIKFFFFISLIGYWLPIKFLLIQRKKTFYVINLLLVLVVNIPLIGSMCFDGLWMVGSYCFINSWITRWIIDVVSDRNWGSTRCYSGNMAIRNNISINIKSTLEEFRNLIEFIRGCSE